MDRLSPQTTAVVIVDIQERLSAAMPPESLQSAVRAAGILSEGAKLLGAKVFLTEQYPKGLGSTLPRVREAAEAAGAQRFEKLDFSAADVPEFCQALARADVKDVVVVGMESHVCVFQTVRGLVNAGFRSYVPVDGVCSRREDHRDAGLQLCAEAGAVRTTTESVVFDWLGRAEGPDFKQLSRLIR